MTWDALRSLNLTLLYSILAFPPFSLSAKNKLKLQLFSWIPLILICKYALQYFYVFLVYLILIGSVSWTQSIMTSLLHWKPDLPEIYYTVIRLNVYLLLCHNQSIPTPGFPLCKLKFLSCLHFLNLVGFYMQVSVKLQVII